MAGALDQSMGVYSAPTTQEVQAPAEVSTSSRTGSSTAVRGIDPMYFQSAVRYGDSLVRAGGDIDTAVAGITIAGQQQQEAMRAQAENVSTYAAQVASAVQSQTAVDAAAATRRANILSAGQINPDDINNRVFQAFNEINQTDAQLEPLGREIDQRMAVGLFDNPLEWLINQVRLPGMVGQYNTIARQQNRAIESAKTLQGLAATQQSISQTMDADLIKKAGDDKAAAEASAAAAKAEEIRAGAAGAASRDIALRQSLTGQKFNTAATLAQLSESMMKSGEYASQKEAEEAAWDLMVGQINEYQKRIGSTLEYSKTSLKLMPAGKREALFERSGSPLIAQKFSDAAAIISGEGNINNIANDGNAAMVEWFKQTKMAAAKTATEQKTKLQGMGKTITEKESYAIDAAVIDSMQDLYRGQTNDMRTAGDANPYKLQYDFIAKQFLPSATRQTPPMPQNVVADYYNKFGPSSPAKAFAKLDEAAMIDYVTEQVKAGTMKTSDAAKQIADFYKFGNTVQLDSTKYPLFGLEVNKGYMVKIPGMNGSLFSNNVRAEGAVDLTNQAMVENFLTKNVARKLVVEDSTKGGNLWMNMTPKN